MNKLIPLFQVQTLCSVNVMVAVYLFNMDSFEITSGYY